MRLMLIRHTRAEKAEPGCSSRESRLVRASSRRPADRRLHGPACTNTGSRHGADVRAHAQNLATPRRRAGCRSRQSTPRGAPVQRRRARPLAAAPNTSTAHAYVADDRARSQDCMTSPTVHRLGRCRGPPAAQRGIADIQPWPSSTLAAPDWGKVHPRGGPSS